MTTWTTKDGDEIEYKDLKDDHLLNILKWIEKRAKDGMEIEVGRGYEGDDDFITVDTDTIYGDEVFEECDYQGLLNEAKKRKLI